jgi:DNA-binding MarR family transcriptional regulator
MGLNDVEMLALLHLREQGPLAPTQLARLLDLSSGGATALVQRLERTGHVRRQPHPTDRRSTLIRLTEPAAERIETAREPLAEGLERAISRLLVSERPAIARFLTEVASLSERLTAGARQEATSSPSDAVRRPVPSLWA